jgi:acetyltransferase
MTVRNLDFLFRPASIAVVGASDRAHSVGATIMRNLLSAGFEGPIWPVNLRRNTVSGRPAYPRVNDLPSAPELGVICTPPQTVPGIIAELGHIGTRAAVVVTGGFARQTSDDGRSLTAAMLDAARPHLLRILGPNCIGLLVPGRKLNASFAQAQALPGNIAFVSQSGALATAMLDWASAHRVGFSHFVSLGDSADVDFGDVIDYLASDPDTRAILLYIESIASARKFMSATRAAARNKPVVAVKAGRAPEGAKAATSHTGALAGRDDVYDAALARAGIVRVDTTLELFDAAETLAHARPMPGNRLAILTNGGGPGVMATDFLIAGGGRLASLPETTLHALDLALPSTWSRGNPVDIIGDAPVERYVAALRAVLDSPGCDAVLFIHAPTAIVPSTDIARACVPLIQQSRRTVFACWMGGESVREADALFHEAGVPTYASPEHAVRGFLQLDRYRRGQELLMQTPPAMAEEFVPDTAAARALLQTVLSQGRSMLSEKEAKQLLAAYGIPVVETHVASDADEAVRISAQIGFPVAIKIVSPQISHKSEVGGVMLGLQSEEQVRKAVHTMSARCTEIRPDATITGFSVQPMIDAARSHELIVGIASDPVFGPVMLFGQGGVAVEVTADKAVTLPPLNLALAGELISRTRVSRLLDGYRDRLPADRAALQLALVKISQLTIDMPEIAELDINPLLASSTGIIALDARARIARVVAPGADRLVIRPYPGELEEKITVEGRGILLRPIRPEDEPRHREFLVRVAPEDMQLRFFYARREFSHSELARFTQIDYDREMAFIATAVNEHGVPETLGVARAIFDPDNLSAEFAILVRSDFQGRGLGRALLSKLIRYCRDRGTKRLFGEVLSSNKPMLALCASLGLRESCTPKDLSITTVSAMLNPAEGENQ